MKDRGCHPLKLSNIFNQHQQIDQLPVGSVMYRYCRGHGFDSHTSFIFLGSFSQPLSCGHNCNNHCLLWKMLSAVLLTGPGTHQSSDGYSVKSQRVFYCSQVENSVSYFSGGCCSKVATNYKSYWKHCIFGNYCVLGCFVITRSQMKTWKVAELTEISLPIMHPLLARRCSLTVVKSLDVSCWTLDPTWSFQPHLSLTTMVISLFASSQRSLLPQGMEKLNVS